MTLEKRRYQERAIESFKEWIKTDEKIATLLLPTGCGKTVNLALALKEAPNKKILWVAHREELIDQAYSTLSSIIPSRKIEVEMSDRQASISSDIVVGSVQTLSRKRKHFDGFIPDIIVIDEYHHYSENNVQYKGLLDRWPEAKMVGATATAWRTSGEQLPLGTVLIEMDIGTAVDKGYLVKPVPEVLDTNISLADVKTRMGDFAIADLSKAVNVESRNNLIANRIVELVKSGRQGILFAVDVAHSKAMHNILKDKVRSAEIYGETPTEERREIIKKIRNKEIDVICNNLVLGEGTDLPHLSFVCIARPTRSLGLYLQCAGRGLRKYPGKNDCIIVDVHDKIKLKQTRITFADMAVAGDLSGDKKRSASMLEAEPDLDPIAKTLKNFPVFVRKREMDRWQLDDETFSFACWAVSANQWITTWVSEKEMPKTISRQVKDRIIKEYVPGEFDKIKTEKIFYICCPNTSAKGRLLSFVKNAGVLILESDQRLFKSEIDEKLYSQAKQDGVLPLVMSGAKWKQTPASPKQIDLVKNLIRSNRIGFDLDVDHITKGEASAVIDQSRWQDIINKKFGTFSKSELLGYDVKLTDV